MSQTNSTSSASTVKKIWQRAKRIFLWLFVIQLIYIIALRWIDPPITLTQLGAVISGDGLKRDYINADEISPYAGLAVISSEDQLFPDHNGFDWTSIQKAMAYNKRKPGRVRGASTISQQVAKNVFLWQGRSYIRKGLEVYFTFMIELIWGKKRILEVYLNVIEMGPGIYGIEAASQQYFKKHAFKLTMSEAAAIAACLPNPKRYRVNPPSPYVSRRTGAILRQMGFLHPDPDIKKVIGER
jgi:monofunctional biosynthetic peptidoglycan transglycosylase